MSLATEDAFEVLPALLHNHQNFERIGDLGNIVLPHIDLVVKLLVEGRTLVFGECA